MTKVGNTGGKDCGNKGKRYSERLSLNSVHVGQSKNLGHPNNSFDKTSW